MLIMMIIGSVWSDRLGNYTNMDEITAGREHAGYRQCKADGPDFRSRQNLTARTSGL